METEYIEYTHGDTTLEGVYSFDNTQKKPLVLIFHAWRGRDEFVLQKTKEIAELGYVGFAVDIYGKGVLGSSKDENAKLMEPFMIDRAFLRDRVLAGLETAKKLKHVDCSKVCAIGFCFGGLCALDLARSGAKVNGVISFHGLLNAPKDISCVYNTKVLALHGDLDPMVPKEEVDAFELEMRGAKIDWQLHRYGDTYHAFTNPIANDKEFGTVYCKRAEKRAMGTMKLFLKEAFV